MAWLQCSLDLPARQAEAGIELLEALGAASVTLADAGDEPVLEPGPGATPLWPRVRLTALFAPETEPALVRMMLGRQLGDAADTFAAGILEDRDWEREWLKDFRPMRFGRRLWVCPSDQDAPAADAVMVRLDPGLAFGTGSHPTTALCLEWLDGADLAGATVVDYGCGSGILALAAARLGAARVIAVDNDPQARTACRDNVRRNRLEDAVEVRGADDVPGVTADAVLANILAEPLKTLAPVFAGLTRPGGALVLSGILGGQAGELRRAVAPWFATGAPALRDGWARLEGRRRAGGD